MEKIIEIPEGYEARIEGNKVVLEPKESEDEKTRRMIDDTLHQAVISEFISETSYRKMSAYLEKQKEQKPVDLDNIRKELYQSGYNDGYEHGVQDIKPAEWSEEDEVIIREITSCLQENAKENVFYACTNWLKELPQRFVIQPKKEWSKEDEKCCKIALLALNDHPLNQDELKTFNWLRALKSRFGWKPSEDQIQALYNILQDPKKAGSISDRASIVGLIHDLEKLM